MNILDFEMLEEIAQEFTFIIKEFWYKYFKYVNITKHFKKRNLRT